MTNILRNRMPPKVYGSLLLDLEDRVRAQALQANRAVSEHFGLNIKRSRELEGQARFRMIEQAFEEICILHGGRPLAGDVMPTTGAKIFQPFHRFETEGQGFVFGLAMMPEARVLPNKNISRMSGVTLNFAIQPSLFESDGPKLGDIFVLFLVARHREVPGLLEEIAVGVIDANYQQFLHYEPLNGYLQGYADDVVAPLAPADSAPFIKLKSKVAPYVPPEVSEQHENGIAKADK